MQFTLHTTAPRSAARAGTITTDHGAIETPIFMPVGTLGSVKGVHMRELRDDIKAQIILGNTYHLYLRPGMEVLQKAGTLRAEYDVTILPQAKKLGKQFGQLETAGYGAVAFADNDDIRLLGQNK